MSELAVGDDDVLIEIAATQGAAALGRVVAAGSRATLLVDRQVLVGPIDPCGECEVCRRGGAAVCPQARRRGPSDTARVVAAARWVVPLGDGLDLPVPGGAAVAGDVALAYTLYARTGLGPREPVVIVGAAPVARFLVEILIAKSITPVVIADPARTAWCAWLAARGAMVTADSRDAVLAAFATQGAGARPWRVIATTAEAIDSAAALAGPRATLTVLAPIAHLPAELASREVVITCVSGAHPDLVVEAAAMCVKGEIDLAGGTSVERNDEMRAVVTVR